ncbi:uncharacterized protein LOC131323741 [Rhododendron vialii]|uniref:uncharacterized protein LOC131323741 n=1 Tax=Rhododendron vialii TaxID=182163 RepID=UPI00265F1F88|nr:uncharacterized protein LOC131323741 [Rhododendron vialii]
MASKENLYMKKCAHSPLCPICENEIESIEHILFKCPWTKAVWFGCGLTFWINEQSTVTMDKWVEDILCGSMANEAGTEVVGLVFQVCWSIRKAHNDCVFNGNLPNPDRTIAMVNLANIDYLQAMYKRSGRIIASSALFTEAWALRIACGVATAMGIMDAIFESDCKELINCFLKEGHHCQWEISSLVADVKCWAKGRNWKFSWVYREQNRVGHRLASSSFDRNSGIYPGCILHGIEDLIAREKPS